MKHSKSSIAAYSLIFAILFLGLVPTFARSAASSGLTPQERLDVFEKIWEDVDKNYYDPEFGGVNWLQVHQRYLPLVQKVKDDKDFYSLMDQMAKELHNAHTHFKSPQQWKDFTKRATGLGFLAGYVEQKVVVLDVNAGSNAEKAGLTPGMIVRTVNGRPIEAALQEEAKNVLWLSSERLTRLMILDAVFSTSPEKPMDLAIERADGSILNTKISQQVFPFAPKVLSAQLPSGFGYIRLDSFRDDQVSAFRAALERFRQTPGVILDLRRNGGGSSGTLNQIAGSFFNKKTLFMKLMSRRDFGEFKRSGRRSEGMFFVGLSVRRILPWPIAISIVKSGRQIYAGPVAILISERTGSLAEIYVAGMQDTGRATVVGSQSIGSVLGWSQSRIMKGGGVLLISEFLTLSPNGRNLEGSGVSPDIAAAPTISSLQDKRDIVLEAGEKALQNLIKAKGSAGAE